MHKRVFRRAGSTSTQSVAVRLLLAFFALPATAQIKRRKALQGETTAGASPSFFARRANFLSSKVAMLAQAR